MGGRIRMEVVYYQLARFPKGLKVRIIEILYVLECIILEKWRCSLSRIIQIWPEAKFSQVNHVIWLSVFS